MSNPVYGLVPSIFDTDDATIVPGTGTNAVLLLEPQLAAPAVPSAPPVLPAPLFYGGASLIDGTLASTDSVARDVSLWKGKILTTQSIAATGALATATTSSITRAGGSFLIDKWKVGDQIMLFAPRDTLPNAAVDGILATISAVAALTLTVAGTPFAVLALAAGTRICRVARLLCTAVPIGAGSSGTVPNVKLVNNANDLSISVGDRKLGATDLLAISSAVAVTASTSITANIQYAKY
jgi:hypothetical protein